MRSDPSITTPNYCENKYDIFGCDYNMPASYTPNEFTSCDGEVQDVVGTYTSGGQSEASSFQKLLGILY